MSPPRTMASLHLLAAVLTLSCAHVPVHVEHAATGPAEGLAIALERVRAIVAEGPNARDPALETWLLEVDREVFAETGRHVLPFAPGGPRAPVRSVSSYYAGDEPVLVDADAATRGARYGNVERAVLLVDGDATIGFVRDAIVIATGHLHVAHAFDCVLVSGRTLEVSHAGRDLAEGGQPILLATAGVARVAVSHGAIVVAPDGAAIRTDDHTLLVSSWVRPTPTSVVFPALDVPRFVSPLEAELVARVGDGPIPRACVARPGEAPSCATEGATLDGSLAAWALLFSTADLIVLGRGDERIRLTPDPSRLPPLASTIEAAARAEVHVVGVYEPLLPHARVAVRLERRAPAGIVLVLMAYDGVEWDVELAAGVELVGVVATGYHVSHVHGVPPWTPIVERMDVLGTPGSHAYEASGDEHARFVAHLGEILGRPPSVTSFAGGYVSGPSYVVR